MQVSEVRWRLTLSKARDFVRQSFIKKLPVNVFELYRLYRWRLITNRQARLLLGHKKGYYRNNDAITFLYQGRFLTIYNPSKNPQRIRWTLAHEIGHIVLKHLEEFYFPSTNLITYNYLEDEANEFAAQLLAPMTVLKGIGATKAREIRQVCDISRKASRNREEDISIKSGWNNYTMLDGFYREQFKDFIKPVAICVDRRFLPRRLIRKGREVYHLEGKHNYVRTDEDNRFLKCPRCGNSEFSEEASYCKLCGLYLYNVCTNAQVSYANHNEHCGRTNPGDARYCEYCGEETYLMSQGLLSNWETVVEEEDDIVEALANKDDNNEADRELQMVSESSGDYTDDFNLDDEDFDVPF